MTMITPSYLGETIEYSSLHACRSTLEDPTAQETVAQHGLETVQTRTGAAEDFESMVAVGIISDTTTVTSLKKQIANFVRPG